MPTTYAIPDGRTVMAATLYTGTGSNLSISNAVNGVSYQPGLVWIKNRNSTQSHCLYDSVRGATKQLNSNNTGSEGTYAGVSSFDSGGFSVGTADNNTNTYTYVAWQWKAGGTAVSNTSGTITSQVSANTTAGFSVVTYTATNAAGTIGHGLGVAPSLIITKNRSDAGGRNWGVYHTSIGATKFLQLNTTATPTTGAAWNNTAPTSSVFSVGGGSFGETNFPSGDSYVAYCFAAVAGYSAFGSYTGNGSTDGPFVYTGFRPRYLLRKRSDSTSNWLVMDSVRGPYNLDTPGLYPNISDAEDNGPALDLLSNGFKVRGTGSAENTSGGTYIYACFAENPLKFANAR